jgi:hypothetical protein
MTNRDHRRIQPIRDALSQSATPDSRRLMTAYGAPYRGQISGAPNGLPDFPGAASRHG